MGGVLGRDCPSPSLPLAQDVSALFQRSFLHISQQPHQRPKATEPPSLGLEPPEL
jgi:hypothetical protein